MQRTLLFLAFYLVFSTSFSAQTPTSANARFNAFEQRKLLKTSSIAATLEPTSIGPSIFSCRVDDVDVNPADPTQMYVAYASGGLWYSNNNATSFTPLFDQEASMTIGDIAVDWPHNIIWVGTGECNSSRSSYAGTGLYRSDDGGKSWEWRGLPESHHISRVVLHPTNPEILWVAVLGHLYSNNDERGVYRSEDGGRTWKQVLFVDNHTGAIDLCIDPLNPNIVYASTWQRERTAWNFNGAGAGSGIWKSTDGGSTFARIGTDKSGFPTGDKIGRIGLTAGLKNGKTVLYASVDNQNTKPVDTKKKTDMSALTKDKLRTMDKASFQKNVTDDQLKDYLESNRFPEKYTPKKVRAMMDSNKILPVTLVEYLEDANSQLTETEFIGAEVYRSDDGGTTWYRPHNDLLEAINFTYGYYFSNIRCAPNDADQVYLLGYLAIRSADGGKSWVSINGDNVHADHHALWVNPTHPGHLVNGNDGGLNISWDNGAHWIKCNNPPVGQFYSITTDHADPYNVYGGAQDNGVWFGPSNYEASAEWQQNGQYPYRFLMGGDGMQVQVDPRDNNTTYTGYQFGNYFRMSKMSGYPRPITPRHELGERPLRFNWQTPIWLSRHQADVLYFGANKLYRSFNQGRDWEAISGDLTEGGKSGNVPYGTLTSIHESTLKFGLLYTGSDDGVVFVTRDGGDNWARITDGLPAHLWVSRVQASAHVKSRVYIALSGYRSDDFNSYLYQSDNYGQTWTKIGLNLPAETINVVREDPENPDLLFVGTDHGLYFSLDRGVTFQTIGTDFPATPVHDLDIQREAHDLVIGTHGRSAYKVNIAYLQELTTEQLAQPLLVFQPKTIKYSKNWGKKQAWEETKQPECPVSFYTTTTGIANWSIKTKDGVELQSGKWVAQKGLNKIIYNLDIRESAQKAYTKTLAAKDVSATLAAADNGITYIRKGVFIVEIELNGTKAQKEIVVE